MSQEHDEEVAWETFLWKHTIWPRRGDYLEAMQQRVAKLLASDTNQHLHHLSIPEMRHTARLALLLLASLGINKGTIDEEWRDIVSSAPLELRPPPEREYS
jgi:hypothetical protein